MQVIVRRLISRHWPLWIALAALWIATGILQYLAAARTEGHLIYTLDDSYIHMAMAKNIAQHGVYGVTQYEFSSTSSSPVWTIILALSYAIVGVRDSIPFVLDLVISSVVLVIAYVLLERSVRRRSVVMFALLAIVFFTPLPLLISTGMEHPLHIVLAILFLSLSATSMLDESPGMKTSTLLTIFVVCAVLVMTRFESYALVAVVSILFVLRGRWKTAAGVVLASVLPLIIYQAISVAHGWHWLPNSILLRANLQETKLFDSLESFLVIPWMSQGSGKFYTVGWDALQRTPYLLVLIGTPFVVLVASMMRTREFWKYNHMMLVALIAVAVAQMLFGRVGHLFRYEAHLIALAVFALTFSVEDLFDTLMLWMSKSRIHAAAGSVVVLIAIQWTIPLFTRSFLALPVLPRASQNIYQQQYQMGLFLQRYYGGKTIAANDIGAICYLADIRLVDLAGLATWDIYQLKKTHQLTPDRLQRLCDGKGVSIAVAYEIWLNLGGMSESRRRWKLLGRWTIPENIMCGSDVVSFLSVKSSEERRLQENLRNFSKELPRGVASWVRPDDPPDTQVTSGDP